MSRSFNYGPMRAHLVLGKRGVAGEVTDLRRDVEAGFSALEVETDANIAALRAEPFLFHDTVATAGRVVTKPNAGPTYYLSGAFVGLQFALNDDEAYRVFKIPSSFVDTPSFHVHWTKSGDQNEQGKVVKWRIQYTIFSGSGGVVGAGTTIESELTYLAADTTARTIYRSPNLALTGFVAGYYVSMKIQAVTPVGTPMVSQPVLYSVDLMYNRTVWDAA